MGFEVTVEFVVAVELVVAVSCLFVVAVLSLLDLCAPYLTREMLFILALILDIPQLKFFDRKVVLKTHFHISRCFPIGLLIITALAGSAFTLSG